MSSNSMVKGPTVSDTAGDRISDLPVGLVDNILKRLPLLEAVRTSILSRRWRYKWVTLPDLSFDYWTFSESCLDGNWKPESIIDDILQRHEGPVLKFKFASTNAACHPAMNRWIHFLLNHPIEYLGLTWYFLGPSVDLPLVPSDLFSFDHLKHLYLKEVKVTLPPTFKGFHKVVNLEFVHVRIELEELQTIIFGCPMLVCLKILACYDTKLWFLDIDALKLKCFHFLGRFSAISFRNSSIEEISIRQFDVFDNFELRNSRGNRCNLVDVFNQLPSVKKVSLNGVFLQFLALGGVPQTLPDNLNHLTFLYIDEFDLGYMDQVSCALCVIRNSPNLQSLHISFYMYGGEDDPIIEYIKAQQMCNVPLSCLKSVHVFGISGLESELELVKLILLWATALEKLEIKTFFISESDDEIDGETDGELNEQDDYDKLLRKYQMLKEIASFRRASSKVVLLLNDF